MKKILSCLLEMCVVIGCAGTAAAASLDSELVGLWQFERSDNLDDLDFDSYQRAAAMRSMPCDMTSRTSSWRSTAM